MQTLHIGCLATFASAQDRSTVVSGYVTRIDFGVDEGDYDEVHLDSIVVGTKYIFGTAPRLTNWFTPTGEEWKLTQTLPPSPPPLKF